MLTDPVKIAEAVNNPRFHAGEDIMLGEGPHKFLRGKFLKLKDDVEWASIQEPNGLVSSHPVEWMLGQN